MIIVSSSTYKHTDQVACKSCKGPHAHRSGGITVVLRSKHTYAVQVADILVNGYTDSHILGGTIAKLSPHTHSHRTDGTIVGLRFTHSHRWITRLRGTCDCQLDLLG